MRADHMLRNAGIFQDYWPASNCDDFQIATSLGVVMWVSFELGMGVLAFGLIALIAAFAFTYWQIQAFMAGEKSLGIVNGYILELYSGIHKIKAAGAESECIQQWAERYSRLRQKLLASQRVRILHGSFQTGWSYINHSPGILDDCSFEWS